MRNNNTKKIGDEFSFSYFIPFAFIILAFTNCNTSKKAAMSDTTVSLTSEEISNGWMMLFDGKSTAGWHTYGKAGVGKAWKVDNGKLWFDAGSIKSTPSNERGDIITDNEYENFHLKLEWNIAKNGNSGIILFVNEDPAKYEAAWQSGPEMQVLDNNGHPDAKIIKHRAGDLYDLLTAKETVKPAGEWNEVEIIANKGMLQFFINGVEVLKTSLWDESWRQLIANSKFKNIPGFGTFRKGHIALQDHGDDVWYKNIKIKAL